MSRRLDAKSKSSVYLHFRVTPEEEARIKGLAHYKGISYGAMLRDLAEEERRRLYDGGKRPPVRPPEDGDDAGPKTPRRGKP